MFDLLEDYYPLAVFIVAMTLLLGGLVIGLNALDRANCSASWKDSGMEHRWSPIGGCQLQYKGAWLPAENFRAIQ